MIVEFLNLKKLNEKYETEFQNIFSSFLNSGHYILGNEVKSFEKDFATYCGVQNCIGVGNGLDALFLIFKAYIELGKLKLGDEIIVSANTYIATILAIQNAGLVPVLVEPNSNTYNLDVKLIPQKISKKTKAVLVTHLYGQLADMNSLRKIVEENELLLISDSAQAHGAEDSNSAKAGCLADAAGFSFYPTKNLGALGDGGAVVTNNQLLADCVMKIRNYGTISKYVNQYVGVNSRLDEIQASFLKSKLKHLDNDNELRRNIAKRYITEINNKNLKMPYWDGSKNHVFHQFVVQTSKRDDFENYLKINGIQTLIHYPIPPHKQNAFKGVFKETYPITEQLCEQIISLPINIALKDEEIDFIIKIVNDYLC